ncbi:hypothetical protein ABBQ32_000431 [Trebouxia sp. C0010 RCD-2024]
MITFSRKKAAVPLPSLLISHEDKHNAENSLPRSFKINTHTTRAEHSSESHEVPGTGRDSALEHQQEAMTHSYEPQEIQQPHGYSDIDSESNRAPAYKLPINPKHFKGRYMPPAPTTTTKKLLTKFQQRSGVTPLTDLDSLNGSSDKLITSSKVSAEQSGMSSEDDASSYAPSCTKPVPKAAAKGKPPVARPPLHPRTFTKHDPNTVQQQTTMPCAPHGAAKPSRTMNESQVLQGKPQGHEYHQDSLPTPAKRQRLSKTVLQTADLHMSKAAICNMMSANDLLVEMPPAFDVAGDTGSIGRFSAVSGGSNTSVEMDIKGTMYNAVAAPCPSSLLLVKVTNTGHAGSATVELVANDFVQAIQLDNDADVAARTEWSDDENDNYLGLPLAAAEQGPKAKGPRAKTKRKVQTKTNSRKK